MEPILEVMGVYRNGNWGFCTACPDSDPDSPDIGIGTIGIIGKLPLAVMLGEMANLKLTENNKH